MVYKSVFNYNYNTKQVQCLLQLGENFSLPIIQKRKRKCLNSLKTGKIVYVNYRFHFKKLLGIVDLIINNLFSFSYSCFNKQVNNILKKLKNKTRQFLNNNQMWQQSHLIITKANNMSVALNKDIYIKKMNEILSEENLCQDFERPD